MNGIFANYLWTMFWESVFWIMWFFPRKYKYRCIHVYVWSKDDKDVMWIWLMLKNISLLDRIWSLWLVRFAHSTTNFIFWLGMLIFLVSINIHIQITYTYLRMVNIPIHLKKNQPNTMCSFWSSTHFDSWMRTISLTINISFYNNNS